jgi:hypothetical protein
MYSLNPIYLNEFRNNFGVYTTYPDACNIGGCLLIHGKDSFMLSSYIDNMITKGFGLAQTNNLNEHGYVVFKNFIIANSHNILDTSVLLSFIINRSKTLPIFGNFTYVIIENADQLPKNFQNSIANCIEKRHHMLFILSTHRPTLINLSLSNKLLHIRLQCIEKNTLEHFCKLNNVPFKKKQCGRFIELCDGKIFNILLNLDTFTYKNDILNKLHNLFKTIKKNKRPIDFINNVRDCIYSLLGFNISNQTICREISKYVSLKYKKSQPFILYTHSQLSILEHRLLNASRTICHFEWFFLNIYDYIKSHH